MWSPVSSWSKTTVGTGNDVRAHFISEINSQISQYLKKHYLHYLDIFEHIGLDIAACIYNHNLFCQQPSSEWRLVTKALCLTGLGHQTWSGGGFRLSRCTHCHPIHRHPLGGGGVRWPSYMNQFQDPFYKLPCLRYPQCTHSCRHHSRGTLFLAVWTPLETDRKLD